MIRKIKNLMLIVATSSALLGPLLVPALNFGCFYELLVTLLPPVYVWRCRTGGRWWRRAVVKSVRVPVQT